MLAKTLTTLTGVLLLWSATARAQEATPTDLIEPAARTVVERAYDFLKSQDALSYAGHATYDVEYQDGFRVQYGMDQSVDLLRGTGFKAFVDNDDLSSTGAWYDGTTITMVDYAHQLYAETEAPGQLEDALTFASHELNVPVPLVDILRADSLDRLTDAFAFGMIVGQHEVDGVVCDHVLFGNNDVSVQLWVETGDEPLLRKIVVTYLQEPGSPQYAATIDTWNLNPELSASDFTYSPAAGFEPIQLVSSTADEGDGE